MAELQYRARHINTFQGIRRKKGVPSPKDLDIVTQISNLNNKMDCLQRSVANLRPDIFAIVRDVLTTLEREERQRMVNSQ